MSEQEYLDVTNLTKARAANTIVRDMLFLNVDDVETQRKAISALSVLINKLEKIVAIDPE